MRTEKCTLYYKWVLGAPLAGLIVALAAPYEARLAIGCLLAILLAPLAANFICVICIVLLLVAPKHLRALMDIGEFSAQFAITIDSILAAIPGNPFSFGLADHLFSLSVMLCNRQSDKEAEKVLKQLIAVIEKEEGTQSTALVEPLGLLIGALRHAGKFDECIACGERVLAIAGGSGGGHKLNVASALADVCNSYAKQGKTAEAISIGEKALQLISTLSSEDMPFGRDQLTAICMNNLGCVYETAEKYEDAIRLYQRALDLKKRTMKDDDPSLAAGYANVAQAFLLQEKYDDALQHAEKAREILQRIGIKNTTLWATTMQNLADALRGQGHLDEAETAMNEAAKLKEKLIAKNDPALAELYLDMAKLYRDKKDYSRSESLFNESQSIVERTLGADHPKMMKVLREYSKLLQCCGREDELKIMQDRIESIRLKSP